MNSATKIKSQAKDIFEKFSSNKKFFNEISNGLNKVDDIIKTELKYSKDLRDTEFIASWFNTRRYYKEVLKLILESQQNNYRTSGLKTN